MLFCMISRKTFKVILYCTKKFFAHTVLYCTVLKFKKIYWNMLTFNYKVVQALPCTYHTYRTINLYFRSVLHSKILSVISIIKV